MAIGDTFMCAEHAGSKVVLFCETCGTLICSKCVCKGPLSVARHRDHVYLDPAEAFKLHRVSFQIKSM